MGKKHIKKEIVKLQENTSKHKKTQVITSNHKKTQENTRKHKKI